MKRKTELERVAMLAARFPSTSDVAIVVGIGDDAAVLKPDLVWTIDAQVEGTHFRREWLSWADVGFRSFMAAASDLAAMRATPLAALSSLCLRADLDDDALDDLAKGQAEAAAIVGAPVVGGNLARGEETSITTTLLGRSTRPLLRSGAKAGDGLFLGGSVGVAAAGLAALIAGNMQDAAISTWRRPRARTDLLPHLDHANAGIDVSDGLARDAWHIAEASEVTIIIDTNLLLATAAPELRGRADSLDLMIGGGEDYALLVTSAVADLEGFTRIGVVRSGPAAEVRLTKDGAESIAPRAGFDHFSRPL